MGTGVKLKKKISKTRQEQKLKVFIQSKHSKNFSWERRVTKTKTKLYDRPKEVWFLRFKQCFSTLHICVETSQEEIKLPWRLFESFISGNLGRTIHEKRNKSKSKISRWFNSYNVTTKWPISLWFWSNLLIFQTINRCIDSETSDK